MEKQEQIKVYNLKEISELLKVSQRTLLDYIKDKKLKATKIGGKWIVSHANLTNFING